MTGFGRTDESMTKMSLAGDPLTPHQKIVQIKQISMEIDEIAININEIAKKSMKLQ